jgi:hypothetical protein
MPVTANDLPEVGASVKSFKERVYVCGQTLWSWVCVTHTHQEYPCTDGSNVQVLLNLNA